MLGNMLVRDATCHIRWAPKDREVSRHDGLSYFLVVAVIRRYHPNKNRQTWLHHLIEWLGVIGGLLRTP